MKPCRCLVTNSQPNTGLSLSEVNNPKPCRAAPGQALPRIGTLSPKSGGTALVTSMSHITGGMGAAGPVSSPEGGSWDPTGMSIDTPPVRTESHGNAHLHGQEAWPLQWSVRGHGLQTTESRCPVSQACPVHTWVHGAGASCLLSGACGHGYIQTSSLPDTMNGAWMVCEWGPRSSLSPCPRDSVPFSACSCGKAC